MSRVVMRERELDGKSMIDGGYEIFQPIVSNTLNLYETISAWA